MHYNGPIFFSPIGDVFMYTAYFGLNENPFSIAPDPLYLFMSEHHREALAHLEYGIRKDDGFVVLTGEIGAGKTTLCRSLLEQLPDNVVVAYILNPKLSALELLETICDELHIERPQQGSIKLLVDRLNSFLLEANTQGRKTVLIIDEAQNLSIDVLEQLRLLTNLETNRYKLLQIVLLGQPELLQVLSRPEMRQLSQRITARCHLGALEKKDLGTYVRHRLKIAGCDRPLFEEHLFKRLWQLTGGIPRLINLVCDRALLGAYVLERQKVDDKILSQAAAEVLGDLQSPRQKISAMATVLGVLVLGLALFGFWSLNPSLFATTDRPSPALTNAASVSVDPPVPPSPHTASATASHAAAPVTNSSPQEPPADTMEPPTEPPPDLSNTPVDTLPTTWPMDFATRQSKEHAFADLAALWGLSIPADRHDSCSDANEHDLSCLTSKDSLESLRSMNRPAVLTLYDDGGSPFHVVLSGLDDDSAHFIADKTHRELALSAITSRWFGEYLLLWQQPPFQNKLLRPGQKGDAVRWLAETLHKLELYEATGHEVRLEGRLLGAFKHFQFSNGLTPDGVLGPMSLIHLNTARKLPGPRLSQQGES